MALVLLTIRACLLIYAGSLVALMFRCRRAAMYLYATAALLYLLHVAAAFHYLHGWSHARAHVHVARVTFDYVGVASGAGLYLNYLLAVLWPADAVHWLVAGKERRRRWIDVAMHGFLLFLAFNSTVVFAPYRTRIVGVAVFALLVLAAWVAKRRPEGIRS